MKRFHLFLITILASLSMLANGKDDGNNAVTLVSYEQNWSDSYGTLALKNNTSETIHSVSFKITYLDMKDTPIDYKDYDVNVDIEPGLTKRVDIEAYESRRHYTYYKSESLSSSDKKFKIKFKLTAINSKAIDGAARNQNEESGATDATEADKSSPGFLNVISTKELIVIVYAALFVMVAVMARQRQRSAWSWVLGSILITPIIAMILLLICGNKEVRTNNRSRGYKDLSRRRPDPDDFDYVDDIDD